MKIDLKKLVFGLAPIVMTVATTVKAAIPEVKKVIRDAKKPTAG